MQPAETAKVCFMLASAFPAWRVKDETIEMWHLMLQDLDGEIVTKVVTNWVVTEERNPTIAGIRRKCAEVNNVISPPAIDAWREVSEGVSESGRDFYRDGNKWSHPLIESTVKTVGFRALCFSENLGVERANFLKTYNELKIAYDNDIIGSVEFVPMRGKVALPNSTVVQLDNSFTQLSA
jgi:hypothetical protein